MIRINKYLILMSIAMLSCHGFAANLKLAPHDRKPEEKRPSSWVATLTLADVIVKTDHEQTLTLLPPFQNHYTAEKSTHHTFSGGLFLGREQSINPDFAVQLGFGAYTNAKIKPEGVVWQFDLPEFDNLNYRYHVSSQRLLVEMKLLNASFQPFHPYITANLGASRNKAHNYLETARIPEAVPPLPFEDKSTTSFSYGLGLGLDFDYSAHVRLGLGYQFADFGRLSFNPGAAQLTQESLSLPHLHNHQIRFQLSYLT